MRRRQQIWNKYKDNSYFRLYDIYHWEAHPDGTHPEPTTLEQRITHYEDYLVQFPEVVWPGLVEEVTNPVSDMFGLFNDYMGDQTYLVLVDSNGKIAYQNSFPLGIMNITSIYDDIDALLPTLIAETAVKDIKKSSTVQSKSNVTFEKKYDSVKFMFPTNEHFEISIYTVNGQKIRSKRMFGNSYNFRTASASPGVYFAKIKLSTRIVLKNFTVE